MSKARIYARNLTANWVGYGANIVVMFFLSPFVVHSLGNTTYGVWSLIVSLTGYLGLVEMGTRAGLGRFINFHLSRKDIPKVNGVLNTALAFFLLCGILLFAVAGGLGACFGSLFTKVPPDLVGNARLAIMLIALNLWLSFFSASFAQILTAFERFDLTNAVNLGVLLIRTAGTVWVLWSGGGIVGLAAVQVASSLVGAAAVFILARRTFPQLRLRPALVSKARFRELFGFGIWAFIGSIAVQMLYWTDLIVITVFLGPAMVTFYAIPLMLIQYSRGFVGQISNVLGPQTIKAGSVSDYEELQWLFGWGSKIAMFIAIPLFVGMIVFGTEFITLWMGTEYRMSGSILILLAIPQLFDMVVRAGGGVIWGLGRVKVNAVMSLLQGFINLALTLLFVGPLGLGLQGVALGTLIPMVLFAIVLVSLILRWIHFPVRGFIRQSVLQWCIAAVLLFGVFHAVRLLPGQGQWLVFGVKVAVLAVASFVLGWYVVLSRSERSLLGKRIRGLIPRRAEAVGEFACGNPKISEDKRKLKE